MEETKGVYLKSLRILHTALMAGQFLFLLVTIFIVTKKTLAVDASLDRTLQIVALVISFGSLLVASNIFKGKLALIAAAENMPDKANQYRAASIVRWAMIEGPSLFVIICFFITGNYSFAALAVALIIYFFLLAPSRVKAMLQMQLSEQEVDDL